MTDNTDTTARAIEEARRDGAILDLQGVQALLGIIAWAEDSLPYVLAGETRRVAFMLLEQTMGQALKDLDMNNQEMERDKAAAAAKAKAEPVAPAPVQADNRVNGLTATDVLSEIESTVMADLPAAVDALCDLMDGQARQVRSLLEDRGMEACAAGMIDPAIWTSGQVRAMVQDLKRQWSEMDERDRATSGTTKPA